MKKNSFVINNSRIFHILLLYFSVLQLTRAQYLVEGNVKDSLSNVPIDNALIKFQSDSDSSFVLCDSTGKFQLKLKNNKYRITIYALNYSTKIDSFTVFKESKLTFFMSLKEILLEEISIKVKKGIFERKGSTTIINIENSVLKNITSLISLRHFLPNVSFGQELTINNKYTLLYVDGKQVMATDESLYQYLLNFPINTIEKIEIIQNPGASYDGNGKAILNIITLKNKSIGFTANLNGSLTKGKYFREKVGFLLGYKTKKFYFQTNINLNNIKEIETIRNTWPSSGSYNNYSFENVTYKKDLKQYNFLMEYFISKKSTFKFSFQTDNNKNNNLINSDNLTLTKVSSTLLAEKNYNINKHLDFSYDLNLNKNVSLNATYLNNSFKREREDFLNILPLKNEVNNKLQNTDQGVKINKFNITSRIQFPKSSIGLGGEFNSTEIQLNQTIEKGKIADTTIIVKDLFNECLKSAYFDTNKELSGYNMNFGLRLENFDVEGSKSNNQNYLRLLPSFSLEKTIDKHSFGFGLSRKVRRLKFNEYTNNLIIINPYSYSLGNSKLKTGETRYFEVSYSYNSLFNILFFVQSNLDYLVPMPIYGEKQIVAYKAENIKRYDLINLDISIDKNVGKFRINTGVSPYITKNIVNLAGFQNSIQYSYYAFFNAYLQLKNDLTLDLTSSYVSQQKLGIYKLQPFYQTGLGINKSFFLKKIDARFFISDIFNNFTYIAVASNNFGNFDKYRKQETRLIALNITYKITSDKIKKSTYNKNTEKERI